MEIISMKEIVLSKGDIAFVDEEDYEYLSQHKWYLSNGYAISEKRVKMHRMILKAAPGQLIDHQDRNKLNNQKYNIRIATKYQNVHNQQKRENTINKYKGVHYVKRIGLYQARCRMNLKDHFLGYFTSEIAAGYAYNKKAQELSSFILLNQFNLSIEQLERKLIEDRRYIKPAEKQSVYSGIYWNKGKNAWEVRPRIGNKRVYIGTFKYEQPAINALLNHPTNQNMFSIHLI